MTLHHPIPRQLPPILIALALPLLAACAGSEQFATIRTAKDGLQQFVAATHTDAECRAAVARDPRYEVLAVHMPLADIGAATLPQMANPGLASAAEIAALDAFTRDISDCRQRLLQVADGTLPSFGPILEAAQDKDDETFVKLVAHRLTWGQAVLQLKRNRNRMRAELIDRADHVVVTLEKLQQAQLDRRTAILSSVIRILP